MTVGSPARAVYLAGPAGFTDAGRRWHADVLLPAVVAVALAPLDPWDQPDDPIGAALIIEDPDERLVALTAANRASAARNAELIRMADGVLAVLDGSDVDSGTAAEIGYAAALRLPIVGLRTDLRRTGDNEASIVNLQVEWFVTDSGGGIETTVAAAAARLAALLLR